MKLSLLLHGSIIILVLIVWIDLSVDGEALAEPDALAEPIAKDKAGSTRNTGGSGGRVRSKSTPKPQPQPPPRSTTRKPQPTTRKPQPTIRKPQPTTRKPQPTIRKPQPTTRKPQPTTRKPQPTTRKPQLTTIRTEKTRRTTIQPGTTKSTRRTTTTSRKSTVLTTRTRGTRRTTRAPNNPILRTLAGELLNSFKNAGYEALGKAVESATRAILDKIVNPNSNTDYLQPYSIGNGVLDANPYLGKAKRGEGIEALREYLEQAKQKLNILKEQSPRKAPALTNAEDEIQNMLDELEQPEGDEGGEVEPDIDY